MPKVVDIFDDENNIVRVLVARRPDAETRRKIEAFIKRRHEPEYEFRIVYELDSSILGGLLIIDGDDYFDGTLKSELQMIRKRI